MNFYFKKRKKSLFVFRICMLFFCILCVIGILLCKPLEKRFSKNEKEKTGQEPKNGGKEETPSYDTIRVLIKTEGFTDIYHQALSISGASGLVISNADSGKILKLFAAGEICQLERDDAFFQETAVLHVESVEQASAIRLDSVPRSCGNPDYSGSFDIYKTDAGLVIVNEVSLEQYLYGVVPSEMPQSYGIEALKAQAVCARSYACRHIDAPGYPEYHAAVDDSVRYQVYNNYEVTELIREAVDATAGQLAYYRGEIINAYFFSTSCGMTTDWQAWGDEKAEYLQGRELKVNGQTPDLTEESAFRQFIDCVDEENFDSEGAWYRWQAVLDYAKLSEELELEIGSLQEIKVTKRGCGGVILEMDIVGSKAQKQIVGEYDVREFAAGLLCSLENQEASLQNLPTLLPSAYFYIEEGEDGKAHLKGGGYGHGVGLSQFAAKTMAGKGMDYIEILHFFYQGIEVV